MKKFISFIIGLFLILGFGSFINVSAKNVEIVDRLTSESLGLGGTYGDYNSLQHPSGAVYKSRAMGPKSGVIQLTDEHDAGIIVDYAPTNYIPTKIKVNWDTGRTSPDRGLDFYATNERYLSVSDLHKKAAEADFFYETTKAENNQVFELTDGFKYLGFRAYKAALYLNYIEITWTKVSDLKTNNVSFILNNGMPNQTISNLANEKLIYLPTLTKPFAKFAGWYLDEALTKEFVLDTVLTSDISLYAKWEELAISDISSLANLADGSEVVIKGELSKEPVSLYYLTDNTGSILIHDKTLIKDAKVGNYYLIHGYYNKEKNSLSNVIAINEAELEFSYLEPKASLRFSYDKNSLEIQELHLRFGNIIPLELYHENSKYYVIAALNDSDIDLSNEKAIKDLIASNDAYLVKPVIGPMGVEMAYEVNYSINDINASYKAVMVEISDNGMSLSRTLTDRSLDSIINATLELDLDSSILGALTKYLAK